MFNKDDWIWERDENKKLVPRTETFDLTNPKTGEKEKVEIKYIILTRPELNNMLQGMTPKGKFTRDVDGAIYAHCVIEPKLEEEETEFAKKELIVPVVTKILSESGMVKVKPSEKISEELKKKEK